MNRMDTGSHATVPYFPIRKVVDAVRGNKRIRFEMPVIGTEENTLR